MLFGIIQLADLHTLGHDDENDADCVVCMHTSQHQENYFMVPHTIAVPDVIEIPVQEVNLVYIDQIFGIRTILSLNNKAPPTLG